MKLDKRSEILLRQIEQDDISVFPKISKTLQKLSEYGFVFLRDSPDSCFGDKSVVVFSSLRGEDYLLDIDCSEEFNFANKWGW